MQLEDAELGLNGTAPVTDNDGPASPVASTSRSPSPSRASSPFSATAADAASLADSLATFSVVDPADADDDAQAAKKSKKKQRAKKAPASAPDSPSDSEDLAALGIAQGRKKRKGKGRQGFPLAGLDDDVAVDGEVLGGLNGQAVLDSSDEEWRKGGKGGKKKGPKKGRSGAGSVKSGTATPAPMEAAPCDPPASEAVGEVADEEQPDKDEEDERATSKKDRRRAKEAVKKAGGKGAADDVVRTVSSLLSSLSTDKCDGSSATALQRLRRVVRFANETFPAHQRHRPRTRRLVRRRKLVDEEEEGQAIRRCDR